MIFTQLAKSPNSKNLAKVFCYTVVCTISFSFNNSWRDDLYSHSLILSLQLKLYTMHQRLHAPIDDNYQAKSHSVSTLIQWHEDHPHVSRLVLSAQILFPILATLFMTLFFIYVIELEPRNIGRKLNNQVNSSVNYISASGEAKILIILTISVLFNACTLITDSYALKEYHKLAPEVKEYYYHDSVEFRCFYIIPYLMLGFDILSLLLFIVIPVGVLVFSYGKNSYICVCAAAVTNTAKSCCQTRDRLEEEEDGRQEGQEHVEVHTTRANVNWSILLYTLLSPFCCIATHAYHVIIAFIDNAYHASSVLLLFIIVLFIHVVVFLKIYYYVCKWRNSKKHSDCCKNFCWTMFILCCYLAGVLTLAVIIGLTVSMLILLPINNAINNAPNNIYIIYQGSVAVIAALVTFQVFFRETNSVAEVFIKARDRMIQDKDRPRVQEEDNNNNEQGTQPGSKDDKKWEKMSEKEKELHLATVFLEYVFRKTNRATLPQTDPPSDPALQTPTPPQTIPGSTVTALPTAQDQFHTPPTQSRPQDLNGQEVSVENVSRQGVTIAEIH